MDETKYGSIYNTETCLSKVAMIEGCKNDKQRVKL